MTPGRASAAKSGAAKTGAARAGAAKAGAAKAGSARAGAAKTGAAKTGAARAGAARAGAAKAGSARDDPLARYHAKRDFERTSEPRGRRAPGAATPRFVVQEHAARRLHYDVRLEAAGVLKSWAVPKGPSTDPHDKRLAVRTEDHPVDYVDFEGTIPAGEYGAGAVIVWDTGTYRNVTEHRGRAVPVDEAVERGHVAVWLDGHKLRGGYAFTRIADRGGGRSEDTAETAGAGAPWLLVKMRDEAAAAGTVVVEAGPLSVRSGRSIDEVAADEDAAQSRSGARRPRR